MVAVLLVAWAVVIAVACSSDKGRGTASGGLVVRVDSDLSIPKDIDHITVEVTQSGKSLARFDDDVGTGHVLLPVEISVGPTGNDRPVTAHGVAYKDGVPRIERSAVTAVPSNYVGRIRLPFDYLCDGTADSKGDSTCPGEETCKVGTCDSAAVPPSEITPVPPPGSRPTTGVDGGPGTAGGDGCFDVLACMAGGTKIPVDPDGCKLTLPAEWASDHVNVAIGLPAGSNGVCSDDDGTCYAILYAGPGGWSIDGATLTLPRGVCRGVQVPSIVASDGCSSRRAETIVCGDWTSVSTPIDRPPSRRSTCDGELTKPCPRCGKETRTCTDGTLSGWSGCTGAGECEAGEQSPCNITGAARTCSGSCEFAACKCPEGRIACDGACVKPDTLEHCGSCDHDCASLPNVPGTVACTGGKCAFDASACAPGFGDCDGNPDNGCEAALSTAALCGSCTHACSGAAGKCAAVDGVSQCVSACPASTTLCGSTCLDTSANASHCGTCGHACPVVEHAQAVCTNGSCDFACNAGYSRCGDTCVDLATDAAHCGSCTTACSGGKACTGSQCACSAGTHDCGGACVSSASTSSCGTSCTLCPAPTGGAATCDGTRCGTSCQGSAKLCNGACVDTQSDSANCGECDTKCAAPQTCSGGQCRCPAGQHLCNGTCVSSSAVATCGSSCTPCPTPSSGTATCNGTACGITCASGYSACNGQCADFSKDANNCGGCGKACATGLVCAAGTCVAKNSATTVACGYGHTCALLVDGTVACWGGNTFGQLGNSSFSGPQTCGTSGYVCSRRLVAVTGLTGVQAVTSGWDFSCALLATGSVKCWGNNTYGELGSNSNTNPVCAKNYDGCTSTGSMWCLPSPSPVLQLGNAVAISSGSASSCALLADGTVACWGLNSSGELGDGSSVGPELCNCASCSARAVPVKGLSNVKAISVGSGFACALRQAGTVACWGGNGSGQLGPDGDTSADTVVPIAGLSGVTTIATGGSFACALLSGGTVKCWGENSYGQLGNGTTDNSTTPVAVTGLSGVVAIAAFDWVACALRADGTAMCWGYSGNGGLGNGDNQGPSKCYGQVPCATTPVAVTGLSGATGISVGSHACVTLPGGNMKCWGGNWNGQLGDGTIVGSSVPVSVVK